mmetsp:Transcript_52154/g.135252  ORF Transcript_52154/g.135252 Transcript_52154/m.135252 type:complete len:98 (-) Transcript_52154:460-753(-)
MSKMYLPVIRADMCLEETYEVSSKAAGIPILAVIGTKEGHDKEKTTVSPANAALWLHATSSRMRSEVIEMPCDWYVLQDETSTRAMLAKATAFMSSI